MNASAPLASPHFTGIPTGPTAAPGTNTTQLATTAFAAPIADWINVRNAPYNAVCDGGSHPLSGVFGTLAAAQAVYPFVTSLTQQVDYAALKLASNTAFGADGSEHGANTVLNRPVYIPAGTCNIGSDTWTIRNADGIGVAGAAATASTIEGSGIVLKFDGLWYSNISNLNITTTSSSAVVALDIDGNVPGHPYATRSVQGNNFTNVFVNGGGSTYALALCRLGGNGGQCSENVFVNFHGNGASFAVYYQNGSNALDNLMLEGDMQNFAENGIYLANGSLSVYRMSFESTQGYSQVLAGACDINTSNASVGDTVLAHGNRSEDLCYVLGSSPIPVDIRGFSQAPAYNPWAGTTGFALSTLTLQTGSDSLSHIYAVTTAGTSGGSAPTWPAAGGGTVTDGTVVWKEIDYYVITIPNGWVDTSTIVIDPSAYLSTPGAINFALGVPFAINKSWFLVDGGASAAAAESCLRYSTCVYFNANGSPVTLKSGLTLPAASGLQGSDNYGLFFGTGTFYAQEVYQNYTYFNGPAQLFNVAFASLPSCNSGAKGQVVYVSNATDPGRGATIVAGGGGGITGVCNGTNWVAQ